MEHEDQLPPLRVSGGCALRKPSFAAAVLHWHADIRRSSRVVSCFLPARAIAHRLPANPEAGRRLPVLQLFSTGDKNSADRGTIGHARFVATVPPRATAGGIDKAEPVTQSRVSKSGHSSSGRRLAWSGGKSVSLVTEPLLASASGA